MTLSKKITTLSTIIFTGLSSYLLSDNSASAAPTRPFEESNTIENISPKILKKSALKEKLCLKN